MKEKCPPILKAPNFGSFTCGYLQCTHNIRDWESGTAAGQGLLAGCIYHGISQVTWLRVGGVSLGAFVLVKSLYQFSSDVKGELYFVP